MNIVIVTDAWSPQVNGVVRTLQSVTREIEAMGHRVTVFSPDMFRSIPCPTYPEIRLALMSADRIGRMIADAHPDAVHIATEGPLGYAARRWCKMRGVPFTTAYHTQFPDYVARRTPLRAEWVWPVIRRFHASAQTVMVATETVRRTLAENGIHHVSHWGRGVDLDAFTPDAPPPALYASLQGPIQLYVGRIAVEKNIEAFLECRHPGSKVIVGDGPARDELAARYPEAHFLGPLSGEALAGAYAGADVFVFPSRTDTFGLVMIEAMACGTPVAAYPVTGPIDVLTEGVGAMDDDLDRAIAGALACDRLSCLAYASQFTWERSARQFLDNLAVVRAPLPQAA
ncbi:glycosyltransferase family 1 protein [uncultured Parasphingopyxis sp.]|uniref:glycosyltransferase family 4 protein n=1 Tax=uncultured Parasphingopyxis sp. TaxID=1547918 RepID=UPI00263755E8|nr:glycosyltransferase family 1 protein [uncultured Parasphingopyxis sp.]